MAPRRPSAFVAACFGMLVFGIVSTTLGSVMPSMIATFGLAMSQAGSLLSLLSLGVLCGSLVFGPVVDRFGYKGMLLGCSFLVLVGLVGLGLASSLALTKLFVLLVGFGGGALNGGTNALVADVSPQGRGAGLSILGVFFCVGAAGVPLALSVLLRQYDYSELVAGLGLLVLVPLFFFAIGNLPASKQPHGFPLAQSLGLLRDRNLLLIGAILFIECGIETVLGGWTAAFVSEELGLGPGASVLYLSLFWLGMLVTRSAMGSVLKRRNPAAVLNPSFVAAFVTAATLALSTDPWLSAVAITLLGAGLASIFPILLGFVGDLYPDLSGTAFGLTFVLALAGGSMAPFLTGIAGDVVGLRPSFLLIPAGLAVMGGLFRLVHARLYDAGIAPYTP